MLCGACGPSTWPRNWPFRTVRVCVQRLISSGFCVESVRFNARVMIVPALHRTLRVGAPLIRGKQNARPPKALLHGGSQRRQMRGLPHAANLFILTALVDKLTLATHIEAVFCALWQCAGISNERLPVLPFPPADHEYWSGPLPNRDQQEKWRSECLEQHSTSCVVQ